MTAPQREMLINLLAEYVYNVPDDLAAKRLKQIEEAGATSFSPGRGDEKGGPHYYRVQAPAFLVEYDNTQNDANHIHSVWRDFEDDFGVDLLKQHYKQRERPAHGHSHEIRASTAPGETIAYAAHGKQVLGGSGSPRCSGAGAR